MGHSSGSNVAALTIHKQMDDNCNSCDYFIGLSGVYDIAKHYTWEEERGLHDISPMSVAAHNHPNFHLYSPTYAASIQKSVLRFPKVLLVHGLHDGTVPATSSVEYSKSLKTSDGQVDIYGSFPEYDHMDPVLDLSLSAFSPTGKILASFVKFMTTSHV